MNDGFVDVLNGTVGPGEYLIPKEMKDAGFWTIDDEGKPCNWRQENAEKWFNWPDSAGYFGTDTRGHSDVRELYGRLYKGKL